MEVSMVIHLFIATASRTCIWNLCHVKNEAAVMHAFLPGAYKFTRGIMYCGDNVFQVFSSCISVSYNLGWGMTPEISRKKLFGWRRDFSDSKWLEDFFSREILKYLKMSMETPPILGSREDVGYVSIIFHRWGKFSEVYKLDRNLIGEKGGTRGMVPLINPIHLI